MAPLVTPRTHPTDPLSLAVDRYLWTGDESAIEEVVAVTRPRLLSAARRIVSAHDAEDAVQTAYLSLLRHRGHALGAPVLPWLLTTVVRTAYRRKAALRRDVHLAERLALPAVDEDDASADSEALARLRGEVTRLPARLRDATILHHHLGLSVAEVARLLDVSEPAVRVRLHRARALVRSRWSPRLLASACAIPWFLVDRARDASAGAGALAVGGSMKIATATALALLAAAGGAVLGRTVLAPAPAPVAGEADRAARAEARVKELEERVVSLVKARDEATLAPAPTAVAAAPRVGEGAAMAADAGMADAAAVEAARAAEEAAKKEAAAKVRAPRIAVAGTEEVLAAVDWGSIGSNMSAMTPLITRFAQKYAEDGTIDGEAAGQIQVYNGPLVTAALAAGKLLKLEANTAFTHPAFMANAIAATLEAAKVPLSAAQLASLGELAGRSTTELGRLAATPDSETWALARLADESELRERFFVDAFRLLSAEQLAALTPPYAKDRLQMDIFSAGLMWLPHAQALPFQGRDDLVVLFETSMTQVLKLGAADKPAFHEAVVDWAGGLPGAWFEGDPDPLDAKGFVKVQRVHEAARRTVTLLQRWADRTRPDEAGLKRLRAISVTLVPVKGPAPK